MPEISAIDPVGRAWDRMLLICFRPFNLTRWLLLGFCAWLAYLGEGGGPNGNFGFPGGGGGGGGGGTGGRGRARTPFPVERENPVHDVLSWIDAHLLLVVILTIAAVITGLALYILLHWLRARGEFMFVDGIATNRQDDLVARPWKQYGRQADNFFLYQVIMGLANLLLAFGIGGLCLWIAWPDLSAWTFGGRAIAAIVTGALTYPVVMLATGIFIACNRLFVLPIMYVRGSMFLPAWREFWTKVVPGHIGSLALFFLLYLVFLAAFVMATVLSACFTCCIAALPYIGTVILLPAFVFLRTYPICYLEQLGADYVILSAEPPGHGFEVILPPAPPAPPAPSPPTTPPPTAPPPAPPAP